MARPLARRALLLLTGILLALVCVAPAHAGVQVYDEPAFTKTSGNNAYWFRWTAVNGSNGENPDYTYYLCFRTERNGILVESSNGTNGPGSQNCTGSLRSGPNPSSGDYGAAPFNADTVLDDGANYVFCALDYRYQQVGYFSLGPTSCEGSRIDRNQPSVAVSPNGPSATNNPNLPFRIDYGDPTSPPWPANYRCINVGSACTGSDQFQYDPNCSVPAGNGFVFFCNASVPSDGRWFFCAAASDSAIPDNPNGTNQFVTGNPSRPVNSSDSNISGSSCSSILLDRVAPQVSITPSATTVTVGDLVNFSASATDNSSGLAGGYAWNFGDNTPGANGSSVSHTYTQIGTFQARVTTQDAAGNTGTATRNIVVQAAGSGSGGGSSSGGGTVGTPPTSAQIVNQVGGGGIQKAAVGGLDVVAPKRLSTRVCKKKGGKRRCSRLKSLPMVLSPDDAGKVDLALVRGSRVVAKTAATFKFAGTFGLKMRLPKNLKAGKYGLKVSYTPRSGAPSKKTLKLKVVSPRKARARRAVASSSRRPRLAGSAPYKPDVAAMRRAKRPIRIR